MNCLNFPLEAKCHSCRCRARTLLCNLARHQSQFHLCWESLILEPYMYQISDKGPDRLCLLRKIAACNFLLVIQSLLFSKQSIFCLIFRQIPSKKLTTFQNNQLQITCCLLFSKQWILEVQGQNCDVQQIDPRTQTLEMVEVSVSSGYCPT